MEPKLPEKKPQCTCSRLLAFAAAIAASLLVVAALGAGPAQQMETLRVGSQATTVKATQATDTVAAIEPAAPVEWPHVLIVTPVKDSLKVLPRYFRLLRNLSHHYPISRLSISLLDGDSSDKVSKEDMQALAAVEPDLDPSTVSGTLARLLVESHSLSQEGWHHVSVTREDLGVTLAREGRHAQEAQRDRRAALARSRNHALVSGLRPEHEWVLWLDSDLERYPGSILADLLGSSACAGAQGVRPMPAILVPNVVMTPGGRSYDLNSWRGGGAPDSTASPSSVQSYHDALDVDMCRTALRGTGTGTGDKGGGEAHKEGEKPSKHEVAACSSGGNGALRLEGYGRTGALYLDKLRKEISHHTTPPATCGLVRLDAVGGGVLLVKAELHRHGLMFPITPYRHRVETEGLSMLALDMGVLSWGVPGLEVVHK